MQHYFDEKVHQNSIFHKNKHKISWSAEKKYITLQRIETFVEFS